MIQERERITVGAEREKTSCGIRLMRSLEMGASDDESRLLR
jgi:hypothetical protein